MLILDTSAWMNARVGQTRLMDQARTAARNYLRLITPADRVMVVRADVLATPATLFCWKRAARTIFQWSIRACIGSWT